MAKSARVEFEEIAYDAITERNNWKILAFSLHACLKHAIDLACFTPGGSTERWAKEVIADFDREFEE